DAVATAMLAGRYRIPQPRNALAAVICDHAAAAMDISDGLAGDLAKLCAASGVSATIDATAIPVSGAAKTLLQTSQAEIEALLSGGDDYEILCTVPENQWAAFKAATASVGVPVTEI